MEGSVKIGSKLGHYEIVGPLGAGGMGEVYRAQDTNLKREVALKLLPKELATDPERLARLEREAQLLAALNHPNIATIHGLEESDRVRFLAMELVEGETLAERLGSGAGDVATALHFALQIAEALEAAHEKGIIHRDLKPGNVVVSELGVAKVLDFGLDKAHGSATEASPDITESPTVAAATQMGIILGTAAYMSPEQARGTPLDERSDIWSFGCVLYEMLSGRKAFEGETVSDTMAAILKQDPDWDALPDKTPWRIRDLLRRCLNKDARLRLRAIGDAWIEIQDASTGAHEPATSRGRRSALPLRQVIMVGLASALIAMLLTLGVARRESQSVSSDSFPTAKLAVVLPGDLELQAFGFPTALAISPDGSNLIYGGTESGIYQLYLRPMDQLVATPLAGTEGGYNPFFSPDGQWVGFAANDKLLKVPLSGGSPLPITEIAALRGASWGQDDNIILAPGLQSGLARVPAAGGPLEEITTVDFEGGEDSHRWPQVLPDGKTVVFNVVTSGRYDSSEIVALSLETGETTVLPEVGADPYYVSSGHLVFGREASLLAVPFDLQRLEITGSAVSVVEGAFITVTGPGSAFFAVSDTGTLVYQPEFPNDRTLVLVDRRGREEPLRLGPGPFLAPRFSPDGRRIAYDHDNEDIWIYELERGTADRFTTDPSDDVTPLWAADGESLVFSSNRAGFPNLFRQPTLGRSVAEHLVPSINYQFGNSFSPEGRYLLYREQDEATDWDIWVLPTAGLEEPRPFLKTAFFEGNAEFSPDGEWVAYTFDESGGNEVYVAPFSGSGRRQRISTDGGHSPRWSADGSELLFWSPSAAAMMSVPISLQDGFSAGSAESLFGGDYLLGRDTRQYDLAPDGQQFVMIRESQREIPDMVLVLNWFEELRRLVPTR